MDTTRKPYHHGDLHRALLTAAGTIVERDGPSALTLRAAAREAGVSHAAPAHHFGDLTGLASELAAIGYAQFRDRLQAAAAEAAPQHRLRAMGRAYVSFARDRPGLFTLMFRGDRLDFTRPALCDAAAGAWQALSGAAGGDTAPPLRRMAERIAPWALVHGLAFLLIDGRLDPALAQLPEAERDVDALIDAVLGAGSMAPQPAA